MNGVQCRLCKHDGLEIYEEPCNTCSNTENSLFEEKIKQNVGAAPSSAERSVYPLLADVLAEFLEYNFSEDERMFVMNKSDFRTLLSKYFS